MRRGILLSIIAYVYVVNEIQKQLNDSLPRKRFEKLMTPNGTMFNISLWYSGVPEQFLNHILHGQ